MDPCPFVRVLVGNLAIKSSSVQYATSCFCKIKLDNHPQQRASIPLISQENQYPDAQSHSLGACFSLDKEDITENYTKPKKTAFLKISVYKGFDGTSCGLGREKLVGKFLLPLDLTIVDSRACVYQNGWVDIAGKNMQLFLTVRAEPDPRFVFQFDGEPECSPQIFQVQGHLKQPVFTCKFSFRNNGDRNLTSRSSMTEQTASRNQTSKERKGWSITIHDLSGSPVAAASMVTPFVPSPGSDRVSRANPGAWLILRPGDNTWKPWGRLEAWREPGGSHNLGYRFEILPDSAACTGATLANSSISTRTGGKFTIDRTTGVSSPISSAHSSFDLGSGSTSRTGSGSGSEFGVEVAGSHFGHRGFVMSSTVEGSGKCSKPNVEVGVGHVTCAEDAAAFVALAAAVDLSMDACKLFSQKLRKELRQQSQEFVV